MQEEIRWHYRFKNFARAYSLLREAFESDSLNNLEREGAAQRFEYTFELAWKTLADRLKYGGILIPEISPRKIIQEAYAARYIDNPEEWLNMLVDRNRMSHTYDSKIFESVADNIRRRHLAVLDGLYEKLNRELNES